MALILKDTGRRKMIILLGVFAGLAVAGGAYLLFFTESPGTASSTDATIQAIQKEAREMHELDQSLLPDLNRVYSDSRFQRLQQYGLLPVEVGSQGRSNPFAPISP